jgi:hypothetical protein
MRLSLYSCLVGVEGILALSVVLVSQVVGTVAVRE